MPARVRRNISFSGASTNDSTDVQSAPHAGGTLTAIPYRDIARLADALIIQNQRFQEKMTEVVAGLRAASAANRRDVNRILLPRRMREAAEALARVRRHPSRAVDDLLRDIVALIDFFDEATTSGVELTQEEQSTVTSLRVARGELEAVPDEARTAGSNSPGCGRGRGGGGGGGSGAAGRGGMAGVSRGVGFGVR
jgi:hypothetical protein